jgi:hypothetical protein
MCLPRVVCGAAVSKTRRCSKTMYSTEGCGCRRPRLAGVSGDGDDMPKLPQLAPSEAKLTVMGAGPLTDEDADVAPPVGADDDRLPRRSIDSPHRHELTGL